MATILATATPVPDYAFTQVEMMGVLPDWFALDPARLEQALSWYSRAAVETRYSVLPFPSLLEHRPLDRTMELFREHVSSLGRRVATECLERAGLTVRDVDLLITVSCTGVIIPPLDALLAEALGLRPDLRRLPITELGRRARWPSLASVDSLSVSQSSPAVTSIRRRREGRLCRRHER